MKTETIQVAEPIIIPDECGDTLWDEVLQQEINVCKVNPVSPNAALLLRDIKADLSANRK